MTGTTKSLGCDAGGTFIEFYRDDDGGSGYGDHARVARWYADTAECQRIMQSDRAPAGLRWTRIEDIPERADPFDLACERRFD